MSDKKKYCRVMTIAGSDCSGGAGLQADLKTFSALECYGASAVTALVDEDTVRVNGILPVSPEFVASQIRTIINDIGVDAIKTGMLGSAEVVCAVAEELTRHERVPLVVDPVLVATSGDELTKANAKDAIVEKLMPMATIITPNIPEAEALLGRKITTLDEMKTAAVDLGKHGSAVLLKGGHMVADSPLLTDVFFDPKSDQLLEIPSPKVDTQNTHGTGCTLSSAIAAYLAKGHSLLQAVVAAKEYMNGAIARGAEFEIGKGHGPVCHFHNVWGNLN